MKNNKIKNIQKISEEFVENNEKIKEYILKEKFRSILKKEYPNLYEEVYVDYFKDNILYIKVLDSSSKHYIHNNKNKILETIKKEVNFLIVDMNIRIN